MGPALTRLFTLAKSNMAGPDEFEAPFIIEKLFKDHGEALIEALEGLVNIGHEMYRGLQCDHGIGICVCQEQAILKMARNLLAQLEQEARP